MKLHILIILMLIFSSISCNQLNKSKYSEFPIETSAARLVAEYTENASKADEKYKGQTVIFTGNVRNSAEIRGTIGVYFSPISSSERLVLCLIDKSSEPDTYPKLEQKQGLTFMGIVRSDTGKSVIFIDNCKIK